MPRPSPTAPPSAQYVNETADENGGIATDPLRPPRAGRRLVERRGPLDAHVEHGPARAPPAHARASMLLSAAATTATPGPPPAFPGEADFRGRLVHPQFWPEGLDHAGKQVVVIGSGATAVTLVPAMAETAAHVTMLQRSPTYVVTRPSVDGIAQP
jgi:monooxygenase